VVDNPKFCRFITPSIIDRDKLVVAISTAGAAPVFARSLRARLEALLPQSLGPLFDFVASKRDEVQQKVPSAQGRRRFWEQFFSINGDKWDADTPTLFQQGFDLGDKQGSLLLLDENTVADLLPLGVMPMLSKLDCIYAQKAITFELNELLRRDAERSDEINPEHLAKQWALGEQMLVISDETQLLSLKAHFPAAQHIIPGRF
jgi:precorrin-2 dehydrogenase/sirohydrochlorin ferrochelatase